MKRTAVKTRVYLGEGDDIAINIPYCYPAYVSTTVRAGMNIGARGQLRFRIMIILIIAPYCGWW